MTPIVIDTETTGMSDEDEIIEIAAVRSRTDFADALCKPKSAKISFGAMATHHITPGMLEEVGWIGEAISKCGLALPEADAVLVMHNAEYDRKYLPPYLQDLPFVCTYRCALHLCPDAESHSNGALWYELGLAQEMPPEAGSMPHRALFDSLMTYDIFDWMVDKVWDQIHEAGGDVPSRDVCIESLVRMTTAPVLLKKVRFGKHVGKLWSEVPLDYLKWVRGQDFDRDVLYTADYWLKNDP